MSDRCKLNPCCGNPAFCVPPLSTLKTQAAVDVLAERQRQITAEGWTPEHDDDHQAMEIAHAAAAYALVGTGWHHDILSHVWPWKPRWWKPSADRRRNLVKAGALILAEIERIDRQERPA